MRQSVYPSRNISKALMKSRSSCPWPLPLLSHNTTYRADCKRGQVGSSVCNCGCGSLSLHFVLHFRRSMWYVCGSCWEFPLPFCTVIAESPALVAPGASGRLGKFCFHSEQQPDTQARNNSFCFRYKKSEKEASVLLFPRGMEWRYASVYLQWLKNERIFFSHSSTSALLTVKAP